MKITRTLLRNLIKEELSKNSLTESTLVSKFYQWDPPTKKAAKKVDDLLKSAGVTDKKILNSLVDAIEDLAWEYAEERVSEAEKDNF